MHGCNNAPSHPMHWRGAAPVRTSGETDVPAAEMSIQATKNTRKRLTLYGLASTDGFRMAKRTAGRKTHLLLPVLQTVP